MAEIFVIKNLVLARGSENSGFPTVTAAWGVTGKSSWGYDGYYDEEWHFNASKNMSGNVTQQSGAGAATGDIVWTRNGDGYHSTAYCCYNRSKYHPVTSGRYLNSVTCKVIHGSGGNTRSTSGTYTFSKPKNPLIEDAEYNTSTHDVTFTVTADDEGPAGNKERYDTLCRIMRQDSADRDNAYASETSVAGWSASTEASRDRTYRLSDAASLLVGQWVKLTCEAYSRGLAGDSETVKKVFVYAHPAQASITSIVASGLESTDHVTVRFNLNVTDTAPVDSVKLQRLRSSSITSAAAAGLASGWADVSGAVDDGNSSGLTDLVQDALPTAKTHTWYRLVTTHGAFTRNSVPVEATCLYRAKTPQADDEVSFVSVKPSDDGTAIVCQLAWNDDDSNTTQITWSEHEDAWESTEQPNSCDITWEDATPATGFGNSATVSVRGLEEGSLYYLRARRALISDESTSYGDWCYPASGYYPASTATAPKDLILSVPSVVERGDGVECSWTFDGSEQTAWQVCMLDGTARKELASGIGPSHATVIPAARFEGMDSVKLSVGVSCGGDWAASDWVPVTFDVSPTLTMTVPATLTAQPVSLTLTCSSPRTSIMAYITSNGVSSATPAGSAVQSDGDVVWADVLSPSWTASGSSWTATVSAPPGLALYDGASYSVTAVATDTKTQLSSDWAEATFAVAWAHQAYEPSTSSAIVTDGLTATITPAAPSIPSGVDDEVADTDVCDVYRYTPDGAYLIAKDVPFGTSVTDRFAPFSNRADLAYVLCTRTVDGDMAWADYAYELGHASLRIDFAGESVELPYNLAMTDGWEKGFELREHLDGTRAGYWNEGATRKATLSTDVVKVESAGQRRLLSDLAKHSGACFVRTPDGCAYPADVEVDSYGVTYDSGAVPVSISATEIAMTDEFRIQPTDWEEE